MADNFDIGPLEWVKDEINQSLNSVMENLNSIQNEGEDSAVLRFSHTYLYQVSGALDMVGLEGCKRFCVELEHLAKKLEKKELEATSEMIEAFIKAVKTLKFYIQELLNGAPDIPIRLFPVLNPIAEALGGKLEESELFFPDMSNVAPKDVPSKEFSDEGYPHFIVEQRLQYQKSLLKWLQTKQYSAVESMRDAVANVSHAQHKSSVKTLWWAASAFTETLEEPAIAENPSAKKLCRRLDQELRLLADGVSKPHNNLLRDILYFVAISEIDKSTIVKVKEVFELGNIGDIKSSGGVDFGQANTNELEVVKQLKEGLELLHAIWSDVSDCIEINALKEEIEQPLVELDNALIAKFSDKLSAIQGLAEKLKKAAVKSLFDALLTVSLLIREDKTKSTHSVLIEVASALNTLDTGLKNYENLDDEINQQLLTVTKRIQSISSGLDINAFDDTLVEKKLDSNTLEAVTKDIKASLAIIEQALDTFFRNPEDKSPLSLTYKPLKQIASIFEILEIPEPKNIINKSIQYVAYFEKNSYIVNQSDFELMAESLSMVGLYAEEMPKARPATERALNEILVALSKALAGVDIQVDSKDVTFEDVVNLVQGTENRDKLSEEAEQGNTVIDQAFDEELLDIYLTEAEEVLAHIAQSCQALRVNQTNHEALVEVRRNYHTLKGSGRTVGLVNIGEIAGKVETFFSELLDNEETLKHKQVAEVERITAAFADWTAELKSNNEVHIKLDYWLDSIAKLTANNITVANINNKEKSKAQPTKEYILVGGTNKLTKEFYDIFVDESLQNINKLEQDVANLRENNDLKPSKTAHQAAHTLGSNALSAKFDAMGELCRALENWLDEIKESLSNNHIDLYENTVKIITGMWTKISEQKNPRTAKGAIKLLNKAVEQARQNKALNVSLDAVIDPQSAVETAEKETTQVEDNNLELPQHSFKVEGGDVDQELLNLFIDEAHDLLPEISSELRAWQADPIEKMHATSLLRALHTFKGGARMAKQITLGDIAHNLEEQIEHSLKQPPNYENFDNMFIDLDKIGGYFDKTMEVTPAQLNNGSIEPVRLVDRNAQYLRLRSGTLDRLINEAGEISIIRSRMDGELLGFKQSSNDLTESLVRLRSYMRELEIEAETQMQSRMNILQEANETFDPLEFDRFTRLQELTRMIAESVSDVGTIQNIMLDNLNHTEAALQEQNRMNRDLQQSLLSVRMLPFKQITDRLRRIVRQTARELKKSVELKINGEELEIDRSVLDKLGAPLEHLLRNAVAHGVEISSERKQHSKSEIAIISLNISQKNDEIHITVSDDGAGVDLEKVKLKAIKNNLLTTEEAMTEQALLAVIFETGFSTVETTTQIAGRGIGLDVVRSDISAIGGRVELKSEVNKGAEFNIYLPVTSSVAQVLLVRAASDTYALPVTLIEQAQKIKNSDLTAAYAAGEITWQDAKYPIHHLANLLDEEDYRYEDAPYASILLLRSGAYVLALHVDEVIRNEEVVMKPIGPQLSRVPGMVGATVSGDGGVILLVNPVQIANHETLSAGNVTVKTVKRKASKVKRKLRVMVVDDSLTMRKVLGRLLQRNGYEVLIAKDGMDAMQVLQDTVPDIILTDIEMPRMDGFGLSRNIRDDKRLVNTPLIMISSRTADKHQNLAKEIGVDAFFGKPVQDEELIEKMEELLETKK